MDRQVVFAVHAFTRTTRIRRTATSLALRSRSSMTSRRRFVVLVEGRTLEEKLKHGALGVEETVALFMQIAESLESAHEQGIVHRDLKPANSTGTRRTVLPLSVENL